MHGQAFINALQHIFHLPAQRGNVFIVDVNRVHVDDHIHACTLPDTLFRFVDHLMHGDKVRVARHFGMQRGKRAPCAVVVDDQVMHADNIVGLHDDLLNTARDLRVGCLAQQGSNRVARNAKACPHDERRYQHAHVTVHRQGGELPRHHAEDDNTGRDHVVAAVLARCHQHGRVDAAADLHIKRPHPQLDQHGHRQDHHQYGGKRHRSGVDDTVERGLEKLKAHQHDDKRHDKPRDVLGAAIAERVLGVRRLAGNLEAHDRNQAGQAVGQVVERICRNRNRSGHQTDHNLEDEQEHITGNPYRTGQHAVLFAHARIMCVFCIPDKKADKRLGHNNPLEYIMLYIAIIITI